MPDPHTPTTATTEAVASASTANPPPTPTSSHTPLAAEDPQTTSTPHEPSEPHPWFLDIDGDWVAVTGTTKGDPLIAVLLPRPWVWSRTASGYVLPRSLKPWTRQSRIDEFLRTAKDKGVTVEVEDSGATLSEAERRQGREERLDIKAERHEHAAAKATARADADDAASDRISYGYPMGQPILIGHHSEGRHRRDLERRDRLDERSLEDRREARARAQLAQGIRRVQEQGESPVTIGMRVERHQAEIRLIQRRLTRHDLAVKEQALPEEQRTGLTVMSQSYLQRSIAERDRLQEAVDLDQAVLAALEAEGKLTVFGPHNVNVGDFVFASGYWHVVRKVNKKTVSVPSVVGGDWLDKLPFLKITDHRAPTADSDAAPEPA
ncbi:DUF3560 domain-containing protein [Kineosporia babensis]|uniref:DUF3560 domain-containing protein n=1 Tax=Kineosporia babensis TaxID=499548 RepID=A0A9X1NN20_9ACTN|nr:DUF3560 domain-containing protein [Kineosporia babensis]